VGKHVYLHAFSFYWNRTPSGSVLSHPDRT